MLSIQQAQKQFDNGNHAFQPVSFLAGKGEVIGLLGTSGCGKSTILRAIGGLDPLTSGHILWNGKPIEKTKTNLSFIFQEPRLMPWLSVLDNVAFASKSANKKEEALALLERVGLKGFENHYPKELSGGMAQRTAIARALSVRPELLLLDEPFSALDAFTKMQLQNLVRHIWETDQATILLVTHDIEEALYLCDKIVILRGQPGELVDIVEVKEKRTRDANLDLKHYILQLLHFEENALV
ncbi:ABC transporter ATP-binding protein [Ectobacillus sp. sgz5001026]|uniref:ABC transporter ATP-binding protein n=1 Tax=Ectobacillus sp. sgz5001026 TaxID=3242473 RepID=UPI0036D26546